MDRSWTYSKEKTSSYYRNKVHDFLKFANQNKDEDSTNYCPCKECENRYFGVIGHLIIHGFTDTYFVWTFHGETHATHEIIQSLDCETHLNHGDNRRDDMVGMVHKAFGFPNVDYNISELDALQTQVLSKIGASCSFGEEGPPISRGSNATFKAANGNASSSLGIGGTSHHVLDSTPLSQTIVNASVPQVLNSAFHSKVAHSASNSIGVGIKNTNMNCSNGGSQQRVDRMGSRPNASNMSTLIVDSQENVL
ncbi:hypothetical protein ACH5RR_012574 [Cinchona calisaya]|uniref:Transposase-associated domain-containing protein n=1 Tax=Cinchona calisaya TaxID=153742 RepID=A0ABD3A9R8_9GENT